MTDSELVIERFAHLGQLKKGWKGRKTDPLDPNLLEWAKGVTLAVIALDEKLPQIIPCELGEIDLCWDLANGWAVTIELSGEGTPVQMLAFDLAGDDLEEWWTVGNWQSLPDAISAFIRRVEAM